jgi:PAS domain S-box-containing protein
LTSQPPRRSPHLLLNVDDHEPGRYARTTALRRAGYEVAEAASGEEALATVEERRPALVLLDVKLPDVNGLDVCRRIKSTHAPAPLVLLVSAYAIHSHDRVRGYDSGADGYLLMPCEAEELLAHVRALLRLYDAEDVLRDRERRLALALDAGGHAPFEVDLETATLFPSRSLCRMFGVDDAAALRDRAKWRELVAEEDRARIDEAVSDAIRSSGEYRVEYRVKRLSDGALRRMRTRATVIPGPDGRPARIVGVTTDVTERRTSEDLLRATAEERQVALEIAQLGTWEFDVETGQTRLDRRAAEILGLDAEKTHDTAAVLAVVHPDDRARIGAAVAAATDPGGGLYDARYRVIRPDGVRSIVARGRIIDQTPGSTAGRRRFVGTLMDVSEQLRTETALTDQRQLLETIIDNIPVLLVIWDPALQTFRFNRHLRDVLGWTEADASDGRFMERVYPDAAYRKEVSEYMRSLAPGWRDFKTTAKDGRTIDISWANVSLSGGASIGIGVDIRQRKAAEDSVTQVNTQLAEADRRKDEFIALLAHELRNPLAPVRTAVAVLRQRSPADPVLGQCRDVIDRQVAHMARLLDDLLDVSRLARGKLTLQRGPVLLKEVIDAAIEISRPFIEQQEQQLIVEPIASDVLLDGDVARLTQVFGNILHNAAKYSPRGGPISVRAERADPNVVVTIRDAGIGIDPSMLDRIFELFAQGEHAHAAAYGGLGIGLSLARTLVEMHGGTIAACSEGAGRGSAFSVTLPAMPLAHAGRKARAAGGAQAVISRRVLVADDNADCVSMMATLLQMLGCEVRMAYSGEAAVREAERFRPEVILLDLGMSGGDGYEACRRIRQQPWAAGAMVVAVTGWGQDQDRERSASAGFDRHLVKPVDPDLLVQLVADFRS